MKTLTPTNLIANEVPLEANKFKISNTNWLCIFQDGKWLAWTKLEGNFEILREVTDTETNIFKGDFIECEESIDIPEYKYGGELHPKEMFWDYEEKSFSLESSEQSFRSLLRFNEIYFKNPMGKTPNILRDSENSWTSEQYKEWQSYESKLIKGKLIILKQK